MSYSIGISKTNQRLIQKSFFTSHFISPISGHKIKRYAFCLKCKSISVCLIALINNARKNTFIKFLTRCVVFRNDFG